MNNKPIEVMCVFGTRPEATKMGPLIDELRQAEDFNVKVCVTAQHRDMLDQALGIFNITPDYDLDIMKRGQSLEDIFTSSLYGLSKVLEHDKPSIVLVHGDTSTTFAASLASYYSRIPLGHVEAGLRTFDKYQPFPEEANRRLTAVLADYHFAPTTSAKKNLQAEGISENSIFVTGNTAVDCLRYTITKDYAFANSQLANLDISNKRVIAITAHRRENIGEALDNILLAIRDIAREQPQALFVYPVHPNPSVTNQAQSVLGGEHNVVLTSPLDMSDMHNLMALSYIVLTDSGGIQEEAPGLNLPVVVLRNVTERPEGISAGTLLLAGTQRQSVYSAINNLLTNASLYSTMSQAKNPFGDGFAARRITQAMRHIFMGSQKPDDFG